MSNLVILGEQHMAHSTTSLSTVQQNSETKYSWTQKELNKQELWVDISFTETTPQPIPN